MKKIFFTLLVLAFYSIANASESSHREAVEKLLQATQTEKNIPLIFARMSSIIEQQFKQMQVPEEDMPILIKYKNKQIAVMKEELSWNKVKDDLATAYMRVYSEKEIIELTKFFTSPIGAKYVEKLPELSQEMLNTVQAKLPNIYKKISQITEEMAAEIKNKKSK